ncbi:hypothetical protein Tco_0499093 [Tanacetum coccineum]
MSSNILGIASALCISVSGLDRVLSLSFLGYLLRGVVSLLGVYYGGLLRRRFFFAFFVSLWGAGTLFYGWVKLGLYTGALLTVAARIKFDVLHLVRIWFFKCKVLMAYAVSGCHGFCQVLRVFLVVGFPGCVALDLVWLYLMGASLGRTGVCFLALYIPWLCGLLGGAELVKGSGYFFAFGLHAPQVKLRTLLEFRVP